MKHPALTFHSLAPAADVLEMFVSQGRKYPPLVAMVECKAIVEKMVKTRVIERIRPAIRECIAQVDASVENGYIPSDLESVSDADDDAIEELFDSYSASLTQDFIGRYSISTRFRKEVPKGAKAEDLVLAELFANDVWRVLIHDGDEDSETHVLTTAKILSVVGIVQDDLKELMGDMSETAPQPTKDVIDMPPLNDILNRLHDFWGGEYPEPVEFKSFYEMAIDTDDGLALSGLVPLGLELADGQTLRLCFGSGGFEKFTTALAGAPYEEDATYSAADKMVDAAPGEPFGDEEETDPEMRELLGLPPLPEPVQRIANAPALPGLSPPPAASTPRAPGGKQPTPGTVDKRVFALIRQHVKVKDEDVASLIGVSRQTFINYADPAKKAAFVASPEQAAALGKLVQDALDGLNEALELL